MTSLMIPNLRPHGAGAELPAFSAYSRLACRTLTLDQVDRPFVDRWNRLREVAIDAARVPAPERLIPVLHRLNRSSQVTLIVVETADTWQHLMAVGVFERFHIGTVFPVRFLSTNVTSLMIDQRLADRTPGALFQFLKAGTTWNGILLHGRRPGSALDRVLSAAAQLNEMTLVNRRPNGRTDGWGGHAANGPLSSGDMLATTWIGGMSWRLHSTVGWL